MHRFPVDRRRAATALLALGTLGSLGACTLLRPPPPVTVPLTTLRFPAARDGRAPALVVLLPGAYSTPQEFVDEGFVDALRARRRAADVIVADTHVGYFQDRSVLQRLREDIVAPARAAGYRQLWLVGISLGGFGALGYAARRPQDLTGVLALAPYLGKRTLQKEIIDAGGPLNWRGRRFAREPDDLEREVWESLVAPPAGGPPVWLGFGRDDRFADAHRLAAQALPAERVFDVPGGHDWPPWRTLWHAWLDRGLLPRAGDTAA